MKPRDDPELLDKILSRTLKTETCWHYSGCGKLRFRRRVLNPRRELYRLLVLDGRPLLPHEHVLQDCDIPGCISPFHARLETRAIDWRTQDLPLLLEIIEVLKEDRKSGRKFDRETYKDFPDILLRQARAFYPGLRRWMP